MSSIVIALIVIAVVTIICYALIYIHKKQEKKKREILLRQFSEAGSNHGLSFSSQEILKNRVIGLDGLKRKLLVFEEHEGHKNSILIDIGEVKSFAVKKLYGSIQSGDLQTKKLEDYLSSIVLQFDFKNGRPPVDFPFYDNVTNHLYEMADLEARARDWESVLSKMRTNQTKERA